MDCFHIKGSRKTSYIWTVTKNGNLYRAQSYSALSQNFLTPKNQTTIFIMIEIYQPLIFKKYGEIFMTNSARMNKCMTKLVIISEKNGKICICFLYMTRVVWQNDVYCICALNIFHKGFTEESLRIAKKQRIPYFPFFQHKLKSGMYTFTVCSSTHLPQLMWTEVHDKVHLKSQKSNEFVWCASTKNINICKP